MAGLSHSSSHPTTNCPPHIKNSCCIEALWLKLAARRHASFVRPLGDKHVPSSLPGSPPPSIPSPLPLALTLPHTGAFRPAKAHPTPIACPTPLLQRHAPLHHDGAHWPPFGPADGARASPVRTLEVWRMSVDVARRGEEGGVGFERVCGGSVLRPVPGPCHM